MLYWVQRKKIVQKKKNEIECTGHFALSLPYNVPIKHDIDYGMYMVLRDKTEHSNLTPLGEITLTWPQRWVDQMDHSVGRSLCIAE